MNKRFYTNGDCEYIYSYPYHCFIHSEVWQSYAMKMIEQDFVWIIFKEHIVVLNIFPDPLTGSVRFSFPQFHLRQKPGFFILQFWYCFSFTAIKIKNITFFLLYINFGKTSFSSVLTQKPWNTTKTV